MFNLAVCYGQGLGVKKNWQRAVWWYKRAAKLGHVPSQIDLGVCYDQGFGVRQDLGGCEVV